MIRKREESLEISRRLMDEYSNRTGIMGREGDPERRYLWTDALAVQTFFALSYSLNNEKYKERAIRLIDMVHHILGKHRKDDPRKGWISGFSEEEGILHPTAGGLRIGKRLPERQEGEPLDKNLEWERDGQYFHYLTRWFAALLQAYHETGEGKYGTWALELLRAAGKFVAGNYPAVRMYWKMNVELTVATVDSMGAHDPLEGLMCVLSISEAIGEKTFGLEELRRDLDKMCSNQSWITTDALGLGGLLLNTARSAELALAGEEVPSSLSPDKLFDEALAGLQAYLAYVYNPLQPPESRLSFRECGLVLGFRLLNGLKDRYGILPLELKELDKYQPLADDLETFWIMPSNQKSPTWEGHLDINAVTLAAGLAAAHYPYAFANSSAKKNG